MLHRMILLGSGVLLVLLSLTACGGGGGGSAPQGVVVTDAMKASLLDGVASTGGTYTGVASYIDTRVIYNGVPIVPADALTAPGSVATSAASVLNGTPPVTAPSPVSADGYTWTFSISPEPKVTRTYSGAGKTSTYTYTVSGANTVVTFTEQVTNLNNVTASYSGTVTYLRNTTTHQITSIVSATLQQTKTETTSDGKSVTLNGTATLGGSGSLSFVGTYSVYLPAYGQVSGSLSVSGMTYGSGSDNEQNYNQATGAVAVFTDTRIDNVPTSLPNGLLGTWEGTYLNQSGDRVGQIVLTVTSSAITWWAQADADSATNFGVFAAYESGVNPLKLYNTATSATLWGAGTLQPNGTTITGPWSTGAGTVGTFTLTKQP